MDTNQKIKWVVDPTHSTIVFKIKHLTLTHLRGEFTKFHAEIISTGKDFEGARLTATLAADSIYTHLAERDHHLKSADFFDAETYPEIRLENCVLEKLDDENYQVNANLIIKEIKKPIHLDVDFGGIVADGSGREKAGFSLTAKLNRNEYGLSWNKVLDEGILMLGEEVRIIGDIQFIRQA